VPFQAALLVLDGIESLLEWFTGDPSVPDWQTTATNWVIAALVIAVLCTGFMAAVKVYLKTKAANPIARIWPRTRAVLFILLGLLPVFVGTSLAWYLSRDFTNIIAFAGLCKGVLVGWFLYLSLMLLSHAWGEWREDLF
jgi:hypothetical protein